RRDYRDRSIEHRPADPHGCPRTVRRLSSTNDHGPAPHGVDWAESTSHGDGMRINECPLCRSPATQAYHSTYLGHPIEYATSWITKTRHYHSNAWSSDTLKGIKEIIRRNEQ